MTDQKAAQSEMVAHRGLLTIAATAASAAAIGGGLPDDAGLKVPRAPTPVASLDNKPATTSTSEHSKLVKMLALAGSSSLTFSGIPHFV